MSGIQVKNWRWWAVMPYTIFCIVVLIIPFASIRFIGYCAICFGEFMQKLAEELDRVAGDCVMAKQVGNWVYRKDKK